MSQDGLKKTVLVTNMFYFSLVVQSKLIKTEKNLIFLGKCYN